MPPEVSVIICVRDGESTLPALLSSISSQTLRPDRLEVIVVDNASRDRTANVAAKLGATVLFEPVPNRALARNRGVAAASADLLAFTDADCVADPHWLEAMVECSGREPLMAGPVRITTDDPPNAVERFETLWRFAQKDWVEQGWAVTANLCVQRAAFERVGGFDPAYRHYAEDADFCLRSGRAGLLLGYCPGAVVSHFAESRLAPMLRRAFFHGYGATQALRRIGVGHHAWRDPLPLLRARRAMAMIGLPQTMADRMEWRRMRELTRMAYAARMVGSLWATLRRVR